MKIRVECSRGWEGDTTAYVFEEVDGVDKVDFSDTGHTVFLFDGDGKFLAAFSNYVVVKVIKE